MGGVVGYKYTSLKCEHELKASFPIEVTLFGMIILVRPLHSLKADSPIEVTLSGMLILVRLVQ